MACTLPTRYDLHAMTYTLHTNNSTVTRDTDNKVVAPAQSATDPDFLAFIAWAQLGNAPTVLVEPYVPTPAEVAKAAQDQQDSDSVAAAKGNAVIQYLVTHTPAQCVAKVQTDVTSLATAKDMLGYFAVALCVLARDKLR
jgi:hypothetical protein